MILLKRLLLLLLLSTTFCNAQIILNAENLRVNMLKGKEKWAGNAGISFSYVKNTDDIFNVSTNLAVGYNGGKNLWMIISNINFVKIQGNAFQNSGVQHLRYNHEISNQFSFETFAQGQYDKIYKVDFRGLLGAGARIKLTKDKAKSRVYLGTLLMYEYEKASEDDLKVISNDFRSSNYLSFSFFPANNFSIISTTYYQPRVDFLKDYRLSSVVDLNLGFSSNNENQEGKFWDNLTFSLSFSYNYDAFPVASIPKTFYSLTNGLRYNF
jgi:hypothetical protein